MIRRIIEHPELSEIIEEDCCEEGVCIEIDPLVPRESYLILKVDNYYNGLNLEVTPPSPDCLIIQRCESGGFSITIVELKSIHSGAGFTFANMVGKFNTCISDFMSRRFRDIFRRDYVRIELYFVSNIEIHKRDMGLKMEALMNTKFRFNDRNLKIIPRMPVPTIRRCYS